jgi:DNA-binding CsgD family transcriptional regulator
MDQGLGGLLEAGEGALRVGDWPAARDSFSEALELAEVPEALFGLGEALWWMHDGPEALRLWETAYAGFRRAGDAMGAVVAAVQLSLVYGANFGNRVAASGWAARAERLAATSELPPLAGWALIAKSASTTDPASAQRWALEAQQIATEVGDRDLELCALSAVGAALVAEGRAEEGAALLDEAMAGSLGGESESLDTVVFTSCVLVQSCYRCADFARVVQWIAALEGFVERYGSPYVNAVCRAHYGAVLVATGDWTRAEQELTTALELAGDALPAVRAEAIAFLADLWLAQGRVEAAADLMVGFEDHDVVWPVRAAVQLASGEASVAAATAARQVELLGRQHIAAARLREVLGEAHLALGHVEAAEELGRSLDALASTVDCELIAVRGARLLGRSLAAAGDADKACERLGAALAGFTNLEMPLEVARTRLALADALELKAPEGAAAEVRLALAAFEALHARRDADAARAWLHQHSRNVVPSSAVAGVAALTRREREVLDLLGEGMSNPEIAERLYVSRRTVEHHVASVLSKLGLRNRTEAAAHLVRVRGGSVAG